MVILSESTCEIVDFKSGDSSPAHTEQLLIYSLLWAKDEQLNPIGRLADKLTLSYTTSTLSVTPLLSRKKVRDAIECAMCHKDFALHEGILRTNIEKGWLPREEY